MEIEEQTSEALAARIVSYRVLKIGEQDAIKAMEILQQRKDNGDTFDFVTYIEDKIKSMPESTIGADKLSTIKSVLKNVRTGTF